MNAKHKLLITGASGFTGQHACEYFSKLDLDIVAITNKRNFCYKKIKTKQCDLLNKKGIKDLIKQIKPDYVLHLAGQNAVGRSWEDPLNSLEVNAMGTAYLIEALRQEAPASKTVIVSSALQFNPTSIPTFNHPYGLSKTIQAIFSQFWAALYNMHIVIARPSNLIGPGFSTGVCSIFAQGIVNMERGKEEKFLNVSNLKNRLDFLDVRDAVKAYDCLLKKGKSGDIYDVSSGKSHSLNEIINIFRKTTNIPFQTKLDNQSPIVNHVDMYPVSLIELGWQPKIPLETTIKNIVDFYRQQVDGLNN
ncbi:NAD-dependent epimerase/dehydratase family protein (plasmid) [Bacillus sp. PK9-021]|uniref:NAD-dependent epimerase/dehydratase family protein n=1 Tax=Priestia megaterium TaxID=1404 RepID=UPI0024530912|nr:NAD-dependent epimerase/dehydratase family protein [Priestia megaterium]MDH3155871.1 NAD-dependent epimerase/dehydratase family protein [Priestia megaterium]MED4116856.1 NAD-dependent epimerase/dehydratase family protein [Priestia megaterium]